MIEADTVGESADEKAISGDHGNRRVTKSVMEKKRRARINTSLTELKTMLAGLIAEKTAKFDKLEKADILELTVKYVKQLQKASFKEEASSQNEKYRRGFNSCFKEVLNFMSSTDACKPELRAKVLNHLADKIASQSPIRYNEPCVETNSRKRTSPYNDSMSAPKTPRKSETADPVLDQNNNVHLFNKSNAGNPQMEDKHAPVIVSQRLQNTNVVVGSNITQLTPDSVQLTSPVNVNNGQLTILVPTNIVTDGGSYMIAMPGISPNNSAVLLTSTPSSSNRLVIYDNEIGSPAPLKNSTDFKDTYVARQSGDISRTETNQDNSCTKQNRFAHLEKHSLSTNRTTAYSPVSAENTCNNIGDSLFHMNDDRFHQNPTAIHRPIRFLNQDFSPSSDNCIRIKTQDNSSNVHNLMKNPVRINSDYDMCGHQQNGVGLPVFHAHQTDNKLLENRRKCESYDFQPRQVFSDTPCVQYLETVKYGETDIWRPWNV